MAIKAYVNDLNEVNEGLRGLYEAVEVEGQIAGHRLAVEPANGLALEDISGLKNALAEEKDMRRKATDAKGSLEAQIGELRAKADELETAAAKGLSEADVQRMVGERSDGAIKEMASKHEAELQAAQQRGDGLMGKVRNLLVTNEATKAIVEAGGEPELLLDRVARNTRVREGRVEEGEGEFVVEVLDGNGVPRVGDAKGNPMSISQLVEEMKGDEKLGRAFSGSNMNGSGTPAREASQHPGGAIDETEMTTQQKIEAGLAARGMIRNQ